MQRVELGQYPRPGHVVAHLSDPHLLTAGARQYDVVDTVAGLELALARLSRLEQPPQALVFTGDLADRADRAEPEAYRRLREGVEPAAAAMSAEVVWVMGNHDERSAYARGLFGEDGDATQDRVHDVAGLRIVSIDPASPATTTASSPTTSSRGWPTCSAPRRRTARCSPCTTRRFRAR